MGRAWKSRARAGPGLGPSGSGGPGPEPFSRRRASGGLGRASGFHYILIFGFLFSLYVQKSLTLIFLICLTLIFSEIDIKSNQYFRIHAIFFRCLGISFVKIILSFSVSLDSLIIYTIIKALPGPRALAFGLGRARA